MAVERHIVFISHQPKIFKITRTPQAFKIHYAVNKNKVERLLINLINSFNHNPFLVYLIVDIQFNQVKELLTDLIQKRIKADLSTPQHSLKAVNQVLTLVKFGVQAVLSNPIHLTLLKQFEDIRS